AMNPDQVRVALIASLSMASLPAGLVTSTTDQKTHLDYDSAQRLKQTTDSAGVITQNFYTGTFLTSVIEAAGTANARETHRAYDKAGRLIEETIAYGKPEAITQRFGYDNLGNQTRLIDPRGVEL